jgi:hypothetical protein
MFGYQRSEQAGFEWTNYRTDPALGKRSYWLEFARMA